MSIVVIQISIYSSIFHAFFIPSFTAKFIATTTSDRKKSFNTWFYKTATVDQQQLAFNPVEAIQGSRDNKRILRRIKRNRSPIFKLISIHCRHTAGWWKAFHWPFWLPLSCLLFLQSCGTEKGWIDWRGQCFGIDKFSADRSIISYSLILRQWTLLSYRDTDLNSIIQFLLVYIIVIMYIT